MSPAGIAKVVSALLEEVIPADAVDIARVLAGEMVKLITGDAAHQVVSDAVQLRAWEEQRKIEHDRFPLQDSIPPDALEPKL